MFCSKCGAEVPAGSKFCPKCGAPAPQQAAPAPGPAPGPVPGPAPSPVPSSAPKVSSKVVGIAIGVVAVVVVGFVAFNLLGIGGRSAEDTARQYLEAVYSADAEKTVSLMSQDIVDYVTEEGYYDDRSEIVDYAQEMYDYSLEGWQDIYGDGWTVEIEINDVDEYDADEVADTEEEYQEAFDDTINLDGAAEVDATVRFVEDGETLNEFDTTVNVIKQGNSWYTIAP